MRKKGLLLLVLSLVLCMGCSRETKETNKTLSDVTDGKRANLYSCTYNGVKREFMLHIPKGAGKDTPLVFMLHGAGDSVEVFANQIGMNAAADKYHYAIVYPQGLTDPADKTSSTCWNSGIKTEGNDDTGYLVALANYLQKTYGFSTAHTFAAGFSNGAFMMYRLAVEAPDTFQAVASIGGTMSGGSWENRQTTTHVGILQINGTLDDVVPQEGDSGMYGDAPAIDGVIAYWKEANGLEKSETVKLSEQATATCYSSDKKDALVWYIKIKDGRHSWPSKTFSGIDGNEVVLNYFNQYVKK